MSEHSAEKDAADDPTVFIGSVALIDALYETYVEHIAISEADGPDGPYLWCACGWRSDDLDGSGARSDNPGMSYAVHLTNAQHAAAVRALQPIVRRVLPPGGRPITTDDCTGASDCGSGIHIHGCFADLDGSACDDPTEHSVLPPGGSYRPCAGCDSVGESCRAVGCPATRGQGDA